MQLGDAFSILYLLQISVTAASDALCKQIGAGFHRDGGPMPSSCPLLEQRHNPRVHEIVIPWGSTIDSISGSYCGRTRNSLMRFIILQLDITIG